MDDKEIYSSGIQQNNGSDKGTLSEPKQMKCPMKKSLIAQRLCFDYQDQQEVSPPPLDVIDHRCENLDLDTDECLSARVKERAYGRKIHYPGEDEGEETLSEPIRCRKSEIPKGKGE